MISLPRRAAAAVAILLAIGNVSYQLFAIAQEQTPKPAESPRSVSDGMYTGEQAKRGQLHYQQQCASCHGSSLGGGEAAPPLVGEAFLEGWDGKSVRALFETVQTTMPADNPGRLSPQQGADIVAFVLSSNGFPAGDKELARELDVLKEIRIQR